MNQARWMTAAMGSVAMIATLSSFAPAFAEPRSTWLGLGRIRTFLGGGPLQDSNRGRDGGSRGSGLCLIAPGQGETVWAVEPTLVLQGDLSRTALFVADAEAPFWMAPISPTDTFVATLPYDGDPLQPGSTYEQQMAGFRIDFSPVSSRRLAFQIMPEGEERDQIAADLAHLEADLAQAEMDTEAIALAKAEFFFERNLNADALGLLFSVEKPSEDLAETRQALVEAICNQDLPRDE